MNEPMPFALTKLYAHQRALLLEAFPELAEDTLALADTLDGMSMLPDMLASIITAALDDETMADAITSRVKDMHERRDRFFRRAGKRREMAQTLMEHAGMPKLERPEFTASLRNVPPGVVITDEAALPDAFMKISKSPSKTAIKDALLAGQDVPGAALSNGGRSITVRTK